MNVRALPAPRSLRLDWRLVAVLVIVIPNLIYGGAYALATLRGGTAFDWWDLSEAARRVVHDPANLYAHDYLAPYTHGFRYSPLFAWAMVPISFAGITIWRLAHFAVLALLPWRLAAMVLLSWPFWEDVWTGNLLTLSFVAAYLALRGNRWAGAVFLVIAVLVPRPLYLPVLAWLAWKQPGWRLPGVGIVAVLGAATLATGMTDAWVGATLDMGYNIGYGLNFSPTRFVETWWLLAGVPLGAWLTYRGHLGWAGFAMSPYVLPYYLIFALLELPDRWVTPAASSPRPSTSRRATGRGATAGSSR